MKQLLKQKKGMTMIELLLSLAILAIVVLPFSGMFLSSSKIGSTSSDYMRAVQLAQKLMEEYKNNSFSIDDDLVNVEGDMSMQPMFTQIEGNLTAKVYYWNFKSLNEYRESSSGLPSSFDIIANLEEKEANRVFYYYDNGNKTFDLEVDSYDLIDDAASSGKNIKQLYLGKDGTDKITISISKTGGSVLSTVVDLKPEGEAYSFAIECFGEKDGSDLEYRVINESGRALHVYKIDRFTMDEDNGDVEIIRNKVSISNVYGSVAVKSNTPRSSTTGRNLISGKHYKIKVEVKDDKGKLLAELYGISK